jgi:hypothetical protein
MPVKLKLTNVRARFPKLFEAEAFEPGAKPRYSCDFLLAKDDPRVKDIEAKLKAEAKAVWGDKVWEKMWNSLVDDRQKSAWQDGNMTKYDSDDENIIIASKRYESDGRPRVVDRDNTPLVKDTGLIYSGAVVNGSVEFWIQKGKYAGIRCTMMGVQFVKDGDNFGGAAKPSEDEFDELAVEDGGEDALV